MDESNGINRNKHAATWLTLIISACVNIIAAVGYVVTARAEISALREAVALLRADVADIREEQVRTGKEYVRLETFIDKLIDHEQRLRAVERR